MEIEMGMEVESDMEMEIENGEWKMEFGISNSIENGKFPNLGNIPPPN